MSPKPCVVAAFPSQIVVRQAVIACAKTIAPAVCTVVGLGLGAIISPAQAVTFVAERSALSATDKVDWSSVGSIFSPFGPPDPSVFLPPSFSVTSQAGRSVRVDIPPSTTAGVLPPFVFQTTPEPGIATNFDDGDFILFTGLIPGPPPAIGNPGPITLSFDEPVAGAGTQLAVDDIFNFTGTLSAFDRDDQLLGRFSAPGTSSLALDNSALFLGVLSDESNIAKLEFKSSVPTSAIGLNQLSLLGERLPATTEVPEPSSLVALGVMITFGRRYRARSLTKP